MIGTYEHDRPEGHSFEFDGEFVAGFDCFFVGVLLFYSSNEALGPLREAGEVEELFAGG